MKEEQAQWTEKMKLDQDVLQLREEEHKLKVATEKRLQSTGDAKLALQERGLDIRENLGYLSADTAEKRLSLAEALGKKRIAIAEEKLKKEGAGTTTAKLKERKALMQSYEEEAALRPDAPEKFQSYSDTGRLLSYKAQRQHALDQYTTQYVDPADPQVAATKAELADIDKELLERAKHKRRAFLESGVTASITEVRGNLPDMVGEPEGEEAIGPTLPSQPTNVIDLSNQEVLNKAIHSAVGKDTMFSPATAQGYLQTEHQRLKAKSPKDAQDFRRKVYKALPATTIPERDELWRSLKLQ